MTTRYRVEYALKTHRRDQLIEWIKGLLAVPFVLHSQPTAAYDNHQDVLVKMASTAHRRYAEILRDVWKDDNETPPPSYPPFALVHLIIPQRPSTSLPTQFSNPKNPTLISKTIIR